MAIVWAHSTQGKKYVDWLGHGDPDYEDIR